MKDLLVQYIFTSTKCWCNPSREGLYFEALHASEILFAPWDVVAQVAKNASVADAFEALQGVSQFHAQAWD